MKSYILLPRTLNNEHVVREIITTMSLISVKQTPVWTPTCLKLNTRQHLFLQHSPVQNGVRNTLHHSLVTHKSSSQLPTHLSIDFKGACWLVQLDACDVLNFTGLLDVGTMRSNGQTHQILPHHKLLHVARSDLSALIMKHDLSSLGVINNIFMHSSCNTTCQNLWLSITFSCSDHETTIIATGHRGFLADNHQSASAN